MDQQGDGATTFGNPRLRLRPIYGGALKSYHLFVCSHELI
jgi:hypothetical protein